MSERRNPFALARAARVWARAVRLKAELRAQHETAPDDFLRDDAGIIPGPKWKWGAGGFVTNAKARPREGKHKGSGKPRGRPDGVDVGLADAVYALMARGRDKAEAIKEIAQWLVVIGKKNGYCGPKFRAARDRIYRALRH